MNNREEMSEGMTPKLPLWSYQVQSDSKLAVRTRKDLEIHLITRALKDEAFKQELLANPKPVVEKELGAKLPEELEINVLEETEDTLYMVLPCNPYEGVSEEELKATLGITYEDVARWVLEQQRNALLDEISSVEIFVCAWSDHLFKHELLINPKSIIERKLGENILYPLEINAVEECPNRLYFIIPLIYDKLKEELDVSDQQLLVSAIGSIPIAAGSQPLCAMSSGNTRCFSRCCCGLITISTAF